MYKSHFHAQRTFLPDTVDNRLVPSQWKAAVTNEDILNFAGQTALWPAKSWSGLCLFGRSPLPPSGHLGACMSTPKACHEALGCAFFDHFLSSILNSLWICVWFVLGSFWRPFGNPNRIELNQKCVLNDNLFECTGFDADLRFPMFVP